VFGKLIKKQSNKIIIKITINTFKNGAVITKIRRSIEK
jgi:hypothetical protein